MRHLRLGEVRDKRARRGSLRGDNTSRFGFKVEDDFTTSVFGNILGDVTEWVADNLDPEDVFTEKQLEEWAEDNGFTRIN
jgi:hypothetical protein